MARETTPLVRAPRRRTFQPRYDTRSIPRWRSRSRWTAPLECCGHALSWQRALASARMAVGAPAGMSAGGVSERRSACSQEEFRIPDPAPWRAAASVRDVGGEFQPRVRRLCAHASATQGCVGVAEGHHRRESRREDVWRWCVRPWARAPAKLRPGRHTPRHQASSAAGTPWARAPCLAPLPVVSPNDVPQKIYIKVFRSSEEQNSPRNSPWPLYAVAPVATCDHDPATPVA
jgi:hypothetical protein